MINCTKIDYIKLFLRAPRENATAVRCDFVELEKCCHLLINGVIRDNPIIIGAVLIAVGIEI